MPVEEVIVGDPVNVVRMTISVPKEVKQRMDEIKEPLNWSAEATRAFREKLVELGQRNPMASDDELVSWMREADSLDEDAAYKDGMSLGRDCVRSKSLRPSELRRFERKTEELGASLNELIERDPADEIAALFLSNAEIEELDPGDREAWLERLLGDGIARLEEAAYARGLLDGIAEEWTSLSRKL